MTVACYYYYIIGYCHTFKLDLNKWRGSFIPPNRILLINKQPPFMDPNLRTEVLVCIDELNQYLNGNVTLESVSDTVRDFSRKIEILEL